MEDIYKKEVNPIRRVHLFFMEQSENVIVNFSPKYVLTS